MDNQRGWTPFELPEYVGLFRHYRGVVSWCCKTRRQPQDKPYGSGIFFGTRLSVVTFSAALFRVVSRCSRRFGRATPLVAVPLLAAEVEV